MRGTTSGLGLAMLGSYGVPTAAHFWIGWDMDRLPGNYKQCGQNTGKGWCTNDGSDGGTVCGDDLEFDEAGVLSSAGCIPKSDDSETVKG